MDPNSAMPLLRANVPWDLQSYIEIGKLFQHRWLIEGYVGRGGFGYVFKAYDNYLEKDVAIKLDPLTAGDTSLFQEYYTHQYLNSCSSSEEELGLIPKVYLISCLGDLSFIVMDFLGMSLLDFWNRFRRFHRFEVVQIGIRLLETLQYLHSLDIVHGDIKPENILMPADRFDFSRVILIDFGVSKTFRDQSGNTIEELGKNSPGGTIDYLSRRGHEGQPCLPGDDVESLAYVLLDIWCGRLLWTKENEEFEDKDMGFEALAKKCELLKNLPAGSVCSEAPQLTPFLECIHNMDHKSPDYDKLRKLLSEIEFEEAEGQQN